VQQPAVLARSALVRTTLPTLRGVWDGKGTAQALTSIQGSLSMRGAPVLATSVPVVGTGWTSIATVISGKIAGIVILVLMWPGWGSIVTRLVLVGRKSTNSIK